MPFDFQKALASGASEDDVLGYLTKTRPFDVEGALKAGASKFDIIQHLSTTERKKPTAGDDFQPPKIAAPQVEMRTTTDMERERGDRGAIVNALDLTLGQAGSGILNVGAGMAGAAERFGVPGAETARRTLEQVATPSAYVQDLAASPEKFTDWRYLLSLGSEGVGSTASFAVPGIGTAGVVAKIAAGAGRIRQFAAAAAGLGLSGFLETLADAGANYAEAKDQFGASEESAARVFAETMKREFPVTVGLNAAAPGVGRAAGLVASGGLKRKALETILGSIMEGGQEVAQGEAQASALATEGFDAGRTNDQRASEFLSGVLGGGVVAGVEALTAPGAPRQAAPGVPTQQEQPVTPEQDAEQLYGQAVDFARAGRDRRGNELKFMTPERLMTQLGVEDQGAAEGLLARMVADGVVAEQPKRGGGKRYRIARLDASAAEAPDPFGVRPLGDESASIDFPVADTRPIDTPLNPEQAGLVEGTPTPEPETPTPSKLRQLLDRKDVRDETTQKADARQKEELLAGDTPEPATGASLEPAPAAPSKLRNLLKPTKANMPARVETPAPAGTVTESAATDATTPAPITWDSPIESTYERDGVVTEPSSTRKIVWAAERELVARGHVEESEIPRLRRAAGDAIDKRGADAYRTGEFYARALQGWLRKPESIPGITAPTQEAAPAPAPTSNEAIAKLVTEGRLVRDNQRGTWSLDGKLVKGAKTAKAAYEATIAKQPAAAPVDPLGVRPLGKADKKPGADFPAGSALRKVLKLKQPAPAAEPAATQEESDKPADVMEYRGSGAGRHDRLRLVVSQRDDGKFHVDGDWNLQGLAGGSIFTWAGFPEPGNTREEAITNAANKLTSMMDRDVAKVHGSYGTPAVAARQKKMREWVASIAPAAPAAQPSTPPSKIRKALKIQEAAPQETPAQSEQAPAAPVDNAFEKVVDPAAGDRPNPEQKKLRSPIAPGSPAYAGATAIADAYRKGGKPAAELEYRRISKERKWKRWEALAVGDLVREMIEGVTPERTDIEALGALEAELKATGETFNGFVARDKEEGRKPGVESKQERQDEQREQPAATDGPGAQDSGALAGTPAPDGEGARGKRKTPASRVRRAGADERRVGEPDPQGSGPGSGVGDDPGGVGAVAGGTGSAQERRARKLDRPTLARDYRLTEDPAPAGEMAKFRGNIAAIKTLRAIEADNRDATPEEKRILASYVGWGALSQKAFGWNEEFKPIQDELRALVSPEEYEAAKRSVLNAHYTSPMVVRGMWRLAERLGLRPYSRILEPSMGVGNFFGFQPEGVMPAYRTGIELDQVTGKIARILYPDSNVMIRGFQEAPLPRNFFDLAISNVPFGNYGVSDPAFKRFPRLTASIHNYFFAKALEHVRDGGVVAFVTSSYTMDGQDPYIREYLASKADFVGAIRLPGGKGGAFAQNAGTAVTTDIIVLRKRAGGEAPVGPEWTQTAETRIADDIPIGLNQYYIQHPEMMIGQIELTRGMYGNNEKTLVGELDEAKLAAAIDKMIEAFPGAAELLAPKQSRAEVFQEPLRQAAIVEQGIKEGGYGVVDGELVQRRNNQLERVPASKKVRERVTGMMAVRDALRRVYQTQVDDRPITEIDEARARLNAVYDGFVGINGPISSPANIKAFAGDPDLAFILAIEDYNEADGTAKKQPVFERRTIQPYIPPTRADSAADALSIALSETGRLDFPRMRELTGLDDDALIDELGELAYEDPAAGWTVRDAYLSGNVREKLRAAETAAAQEPERYGRNVEALRKIQPIDLTHKQISARLGSSWIPAADVERFVSELLNIRYHQQVVVTYSEVGGTWGVTTSKGVDDTDTSRVAYGTPDWSAARLIENALNFRSPRVWIKHADGSRTLDTQATLLAEERQQKIKDEFDRWVWRDAERVGRLERIYNERHNSTVLREFDGSHLRFPGMARLTLRNQDLDPHQKNAIWRIIQTGNTLLGHVVGAGKTFEMVGAAMEMKRMGLVRKPMFVVPNHLVGQMGAEFLRLYPGANILLADKKTFEKGKRQITASKIAAGDYDAVILSHRSFEFLPVGDATLKKFIEAQIAEIDEALMDAQKQAERSKAAQDGKSKRKDPTVKNLENRKANLEAMLEKKSDKAGKDQTISFEELGVDFLFVDEAHLYKNLFYVSQMERVAGLPNSNSNRAFDMFVKTRYLSERYGERGVVFATGTPISNSMAEMYTMMRYLALPRLKENGLDNFDNWARTFGEVVSGIELKPEGNGFRMNKRFSKFVNLPELVTGFREVADIKNADDLKLPRPEIAGGGPRTISAPSTPELKSLVEHLGRRAERIRAGGVRPSLDNMLKVTHEGRVAALDMRLINPAAPDDPNSKVNRAVAEMLKIWRATSERRSTQIVFLDMSIPVARDADEALPGEEEEGEGAAMPAAELPPSIYDDIRAKLIRAGVPAAEVRFIHEADTDAKKLKLFDDMNAGRVRVLLGSTEKMGAGTNIQRKAIALHHLDSPWRPADIEQRNGRIQRQGNENPEVQILHYVTEGSFDAYMWQTLANKAKFIAQAMSGDKSIREVADDSVAVLTFEEIKAIATGDPEVRERIELEVEIRRLESLERGAAEARWRTDRNRDSRRQVLERNQRDLTRLQQVEREKNEWVERNPKTEPFQIEGMEDPKGEDLVRRANAARVGTTIGHYGPFALVATNDHGGNRVLSSDVLAHIGLTGEAISIPEGTDPALAGQVVAALTRAWNGIGARRAHVETRVQEDARILAEVAGAVEFDKAELLAQKRARLRELDLKFKIGHGDDGSAIAAEAETTAPTPSPGDVAPEPGNTIAAVPERRVERLRNRHDRNPERGARRSIS